MLSALMLSAMGASTREVEEAATTPSVSPGVQAAMYEMDALRHKVRGTVMPGRRMSAKKARRLRSPR